MAASATSLIATISRPAPRSWVARKAQRPMRPKPLMATRVDMPRRYVRAAPQPSVVRPHAEGVPPGRADARRAQRSRHGPDEPAGRDLSARRGRRDPYAHRLGGDLRGTAADARGDAGRDRLQAAARPALPPAGALRAVR